MRAVTRPRQGSATSSVSVPPTSCTTAERSSAPPSASYTLTLCAGAPLRGSEKPSTQSVRRDGDGQTVATARALTLAALTPVARAAVAAAAHGHMRPLSGASATRISRSGGVALERPAALSATSDTQKSASAGSGSS